MAGNVRFAEAAEEVGDDTGNQAVFEFGDGEAVPLASQDGFEHGGQGIGQTAVVVGEAAVFLLFETGMDGLPIDGLVDFEQREAVDALDGNDGLSGCWKKPPKKIL